MNARHSSGTHGTHGSGLLAATLERIRGGGASGSVPTWSRVYPPPRLARRLIGKAQLTHSSTAAAAVASHVMPASSRHAHADFNGFFGGGIPAEPAIPGNRRAVCSTHFFSVLFVLCATFVGPDYCNCVTISSNPNQFPEVRVCIMMVLAAA